MTVLLSVSKLANTVLLSHHHTFQQHNRDVKKIKISIFISVFLLCLEAWSILLGWFDSLLCFMPNLDSYFISILILVLKLFPIDFNSPNLMYCNFLSQLDEIYKDGNPPYEDKAAKFYPKFLLKISNCC